MTALCSAFKSTGVTIFTVRIDPTAAACRRCCPPVPPDASHFFMLAQSSQIAADRCREFDASGCQVRAARKERKEKTRLQQPGFYILKSAGDV